MSGPTLFRVTERLGPLGTVAKLPIDYREVAIDFSSWLAPGELLTSIEQHGIVADPQVGPPSGSWSVAFCCGGGECQAVDPPPADTNPLVVLAAAVTEYSRGTVLFGQGTPGLVYGVSFLATVAPTQRRKAVDLLVCVGTPMVDIALPTPPPPPPYTFVTGTITLPLGTTGTIYVNNTIGGPITITLPPMPQVDQNLVIKDTAGNAATYPITVIAAGYTLDGESSLVLHTDYSWAELTFSGAEWMQV